MAFNPPQTGALRNRVRFERRIEADDGQGNVRSSWGIVVATRSASLLPTRGGEIVVGDRLAGHSAFDLWLRADAETVTVRPDDRAVEIMQDASERIYDIRFAEVVDARGAWILMQVEATQGDDGRD